MWSCSRLLALCSPGEAQKSQIKEHVTLLPAMWSSRQERQAGEAGDESDRKGRWEPQEIEKELKAEGSKDGGSRS